MISSDIYIAKIKQSTKKDTEIYRLIQKGEDNATYNMYK